MNSALFTLADRFSLIRLHLTVQLTTDTHLPPFKGAMWHGLIGHALKTFNPSCYHVLFSEHDTQQPKPYAIALDNEHKTRWQSGELLTVTFVLFGEAVNIAKEVVSALQHAANSRHLGIGEAKAGFRFLSVASETPQGLRLGYHVLPLSAWITKEHDPHCLPVEREVALHMISPLRFKHHGKIIQKTPTDLAFWVKNILRRLSQISCFWVLDDESLFDALYVASASAIGECQIQSDSYFEDWQRYSIKQQRPLPFGGIKGQVSFVGELTALLPLFRAGEVLQLGGKTTFGLGRYQLMT